MHPSTSHPATRRRLLEAAGETIAEKGYHAASIREICQRAGANVAAVNYHFGGKERLHEAVLHQVMSQAMERRPLDLDRLAQLPPRERLRAFARNFLLMHLESDRPAWHREIMAREIVRPSKALESVMRRLVRHHMSFMSALVREVLGRSASEEEVERCIASLIGQCSYYPLAQHLIPRIYKHIRLTAEGIERIAEHITNFSLAAMTELQSHSGKTGRRTER